MPRTHCAHAGAYNSPDGGIGKMIESRRPTSPRATFGTSNREDWSKVHIDEELMKTYYGRGTPGPAVYSIQGAGGIGKQLLSTKANAQQAKIGTSGRPTDDNVKVPGPGAYRATSAIGKQTVSLYKTLPTAKIGTSTRDQCYKVFLSKEHEKGNYGIGTPGPVTANQSMNSALGRQTVSRRPTSPGWGFGTAKRYSSGMSDSPGPGAYWA